MVAPDGLRWELFDRGYPLNRGNAADTQSICFWDADVGKYVGFVRIKKFPEDRQRNGKPISGYRIDQCDTIRGNSIKKAVTWQGNGDVSKLAGMPVKLKFLMRSAKLFAFQFAE